MTRAGQIAASSGLGSLWGPNNTRNALPVIPATAPAPRIGLKSPHHSFQLRVPSWHCTTAANGSIQPSRPPLAAEVLLLALLKRLAGGTGQDGGIVLGGILQLVGLQYSGRAVQKEQCGWGRLLGPQLRASFGAACMLCMCA